MVTASVALQVDIAVRSNVMHEVADFVRMCLDDHLVRRVRIDHANHCAVGVDHVLVDVRAYVVQPKLLTTAFKARWACVIQVGR